MNNIQARQIKLITGLIVKYIDNECYDKNPLEFINDFFESSLSKKQGITDKLKNKIAKDFKHTLEEMEAMVDWSESDEESDSDVESEEDSHCSMSVESDDSSEKNDVEEPHRCSCGCIDKVSMVENEIENDLRTIKITLNDNFTCKDVMIIQQKIKELLTSF